MKIRYKLPVFAATAVMVSPIAVHATTIVDFSFTGKNGGTVTGSLTFDSATGTGVKPADVKVSTAPIPFQVPVDLGKGTFTAGSGFALSSGNIRVANFNIRSHSVALKFNHSPINKFSTFAHKGITSNSSGFNGVKYTTRSAPTTPAPEPASIALLGAGIAGIAAFRRRRARA